MEDIVETSRNIRKKYFFSEKKKKSIMEAKAKNPNRERGHATQS